MARIQHSGFLNRAFRSFAKFVVDFIHFPVITREEVRRRLVFSDWTELDEAADSGRGVLIVTMHFGSWDLGAASLALFLAEGAVGLPVFAGFKGGLSILYGPTGGYLFGFVLAAGLVGWLAERGWDRRAHMTGLAMLLGNIAIYVPGLLWLTKFVGAGQVLAAGLTPFLIGDGLKLLLAVAALPLAWMLVRRFRP